MPSAANIPTADATWMKSRFALSTSLPLHGVLMYDRLKGVNVTGDATALATQG